MHLRALGLISATFVFSLGLTPASAAVFTYTGNPVADGSFNTAIVDVNCAGSCAAGTYHYSSDITFFSLTYNSSVNSPFTLSSNQAGVSPLSYSVYLTLDNTLNVTNWFLLLDGQASLQRAIDSIGHDSIFGNIDAAVIMVLLQ